MERILVSVSGGRTSATLAKLLKDKEKLSPVLVYNSSSKPLYWKYINELKTKEYIFVFANTSREDNRTLLFIRNLERYFGIKCVWLEAVVNIGRKACTHKMVSYNSAKRNGNVFENVISKYGIPNRMFLHCTRELKANPIKSFAKSIGWLDYTTVIGYRFDEPKRVNMATANKFKQWYPLYEWQVTKQDILNFWKRQVFDLGLEEWEGNCKLCHKKSKRKLLTQLVSDPQSATWVRDMETKYRYYEKVGANNSTIKDGVLFFRGNTTIDELVEESKLPFDFFTDKPNMQKSLFDFELDEQESCSESCEPF